MWNIKNIKLKNLFSHVDSEIVVKNNKFTMIVGENRDDDGNNGAGKTTVFEALALALTNKPLRDDVDKEVFINHWADSCYVEVNMENAVLKSTLTISRTFFRGSKSVKVQLVEDGELNTTITSVNEANKRVFELIGISREDLLRYFIISQDNRYTFFTASDTEKKEVLNRITSADMINPILEKLVNDRKEKEKEQGNISSKIIALQSKKETLEEQLQELLDDESIKNEIEAVQENIKKNERRSIENQEKIKTIKLEIERKSKEIQAITVPDTDDLNKQLRTIKDEIQKLEQQVSENKRIIRIAKSDLDGKVTCPHCEKEFIKDSQLNLSVEDTEETINQAKAENDKLAKKIEAKTKKKDEIDGKIEEAEELEEKRSSIQRKINSLKRDIKDCEDEIQRGEKKKTKLKQELKELQDQRDNNDAVKSLRYKIVKTESEINPLLEKSTEISDELEMINYWNYYMGKSGFMTFVANKSISILEGTVNSFLRKFKSPHTVNINGFKILKDGTVRDKIESFILYNGMNAQPFMGRSGGERGRINLAGVLAIQHLINMSANGKGLNLLVLDEVFNGIDALGQERIIKILENIGITIVMITQNVSNEFNNDNKLLVVKEDGVSRFV